MGRLLLVILASVLGGCAATARAPVSDQTRPVREPASEYREVVGGDTLYSIAWEAGRDYHELAEWNDLSPPYTIHPGQKLRLYPPAQAVVAKAKGNEAEERTERTEKPAARTHVVKRGETLYGIARANRVTVRELASWNGLSPPYTLRIGQRLRLAVPDTDSASSRTARAGKPARPADERKAKKNGQERAAKPLPPPAAERASAPVSGWTWPADGALLSRFQANGTSKGIGIGGARGTAVNAAADGQVVYQGGGLRGYGQLIIVKHNAEYLSAYAHCDRIYVKEGDVIKRGQKIADMGSSGSDRVKLHFEIRRRGTPVDPLTYLPRKH
jgi:lipoprotein NlpD